MADITLILACAIAAGGGAAQLSGPLATGWRARKGVMKRRLLALSDPRPGRRRRFAGAAVLVATLTGAALAAYAAAPAAGLRATTAGDLAIHPDPIETAGKRPQVRAFTQAAPVRNAQARPAGADPGGQSSAPTGPDALPAMAAGVVGSGDQLSLQLRPAGAAAGQSLQIGQEFQDGWILSALTPSTVTLTKAGASRTVGLNPAGTVGGQAQAAGGATVTVVSSPREITDRSDQTVRDILTALVAARARLDASTLETRLAAQKDVNQANFDLIAAQNAQVRAYAAVYGVNPDILPIETPPRR